MSSKTPKFDAAIEKYFQALELDEKGGQWRTCRLSGEKFYVRPEDIDYYKSSRVPLPTLSPAERLRRRMSYANTHALFKIPSAYSGKTILAVYPPGTPYRVYEHQAWYSDAWDPMSFGGDLNEKESILGQLLKLKLSVPRPNLYTDSSNINSEYSNTSRNLKDCYLTFSTFGGENLYYFDCCTGKDSIQCMSLFNGDTCFRAASSADCYQCFFIDSCRSCIQSLFLFDCINSNNCFMSANLRHKNYVWRGEQLTKEEYEKRMKTIDLGSRSVVRRLKSEFEELRRMAARKPDSNFQVVNCVGDGLERSKNCYWCYSLDSSENCAYVMGGIGYKESYDIAGGVGGERCYEFMSISTAGNYNVKFSFQVDQSREVEYSDLCQNVSNCFGCVGLRNTSFCIYNKKYDEEGYWKELDRIKTAMLSSGEYGEFFPPSDAPLPYRASTAGTWPGFRDWDTAAQYGYDMSELPSSEDVFTDGMLLSDNLPEHIQDVKDDILSKIIFDAKNKKAFRYTAFELEFYRRFGLALPDEHPLLSLQYFRERYNLRLTFYERTCRKCGIGITSTYDPAKFPNVYCEEHYNAEIA